MDEKHEIQITDLQCDFLLQCMSSVQQKVHILYFPGQN
jgi:hypothetical protein